MPDKSEASDEDYAWTIIGLVERAVYSPCLYSESTLINFDAGVYGDDAYEILCELVDTFGIDLEGFDFSTYFLGEGWTYSRPFSGEDPFSLFMPLKYRWRWAKKKPMSIGHLAEVCKRRKWFDPE